MKLWSKKTFSHSGKSLQNPEGPSSLRKYVQTRVKLEKQAYIKKWHSQNK